jgi:hypothetical protein
MSQRSATRIAVLLAAAAGVLFVPAMVFLVRTWSVPTGDDVSSAPDALASMAGGLAFAIVGAFIVSRRQENVLGWIFLIAGPVSEAVSLVDRLALDVLVVRSQESSLAEVYVGLTRGGWAPFLALILTMVLLFPNGRLPSRRWRPAAWLGGALFAGVYVSATILPAHIGPPLDFENPLGVEAAKVPATAVLVIGIAGVLVSALAVVVSAVLRFRRARGDEREQFKWFAYAASLIPVGLILHTLADAAAPWAIDAIELGIGLVVAALPVAVGIAILRYRLYDIDRIINRTLVYGVLTAGLGVTYFGLVVGLQAALRPLSGGSGLAIAFTTLVVAALFLPARLRIQNTVDRRFNRRAYDAARTIEAFSARLREQIDLDTLRYELLAVVDETMQPAAASLWLRAPEARR